LCERRQDSYEKQLVLILYHHPVFPAPIIDTVSQEMNPVKVLLVDNDPVYINLMSEVLRLHSFTTILAANGEAALETLRKEAVDLIISDISMPKMNGINFYKHVRADEKLRNIPFAWNSGYRELRDAVEIENPTIDFKLDKAMPMPSFLYFISTIQSRLEQQKQAGGVSVN
jgi:CheY-like chemotaxis protein